METRLKFSKIPVGCDKEDLELYLEDKGTGIGEVEIENFNDTARSAVVVVKYSEAVSGLIECGMFNAGPYRIQVDEIRENDVNENSFHSGHSDESDVADEDSDSDADEESDSVESDGDQYSRTVLIKDVPEEMYDFLRIVIENAAKGGGAVVSFEPNHTVDGVRVVFEEAEVAARLLEKGAFLFNDTLLTVVRPPQVDTDKSRRVVLQGLPKSTSRGLLMEVLENSKIGVGQIDDVIIIDQNRAAVVFHNATVAQRLLESGKVDFGKTTLQVLSPDNGDDNDDERRTAFETERDVTEKSAEDSHLHDAENETGSDVGSASVSVSDIPDSLLTDEYLGLFFENNRRSGGGDIEELTVDPRSKTALITFKDLKVAESLLAKGFVQHGDFRLQINRPPQPAAVDEPLAADDSAVVEIRGIPKNIEKDMLRMFLENKKRSGGGTVSDLVYSAGTGVATVTFADANVAKRLIQSGQLQFTNGAKITAVRPLASSAASVTHRLPDTRNSRQVDSRTIEVRGLTKDIQRQPVELYFESKKRSGGGPVKDVELRQHGESIVAIVTFSDADDAIRVAQRGHELSKCKLDVTLLQTWPELTSCAVRVNNVTGLSDELISMFFESESRSGGGPIEDVFKEPESPSVVITFESRQVAARVASKETFTLQNVQLSVEQLKPGRPPPVYMEKGGIGVCSDCLLFTDLPPGAQTDSLQAFLSKAAGVDVSRLTFSTRPGVVLARYSNVPDYDRVLLTLCSRPYRGHMLSVEPLPESKAIQVHNIGKVSRDSIELYFESEKRSGGGGNVTILEWSPEDGYALLEFDYIDAVKRVLDPNRQHAIDGKQVVVTQFFRSLGVIPPGFDSSAPMQAIPPDVAVECSPEIVHFIKTQARHRNHLEEQMKRCHCFVNWPQKRGEKIVLHCTVLPTQPKAFELVRNWTESCTKVITDELGKFQYVKEQILQEVGTQLKSKVEASLKSPPGERLLVHWDEKGGAVHICGLKGDVESYRTLVAKVRSDLEAAIERAKRQVKETVDLKPAQVVLLKLILSEMGFAKDLRVDFGARNAVVVGQAADVREAKMKLLQKASTVVTSVIDKSSSLSRRFLEKQVVKEHLLQILAARKLVVTFECFNAEITVYGFAQRDVDAAVELLKSEIVEKTVKIEPSSAKCTQASNGKWVEFLDQVTKEFKLAEVYTDATSIVIVAVKDESGVVLDRVKGYLDQNAFVDDFVSMKAGVVEVLKHYADRDVAKIVDDFEHFKVRVTLDTAAGHTGYQLQSMAVGASQVKKAIKSLADRVKDKKYEVKESSKVKFLREPGSRHQITSIAIANRVVIKFPEDTGKRAGVRRNRNRETFGNSQTFATLPMSHGKLLQLVIGDIVKQPADVIVNAANSRLAPGTGVAGAIKDAGGYAIEKECIDYVRTHGELWPGRVFFSSAGNMASRYRGVIHTVGPTWKNGHSGEEYDLERAVTAALEESDRRQCRTVALPAISCGTYGFPIDKATRVIIQSIKSFLAKSASVQEIYLVSGEKTVEAFYDNLPKDVKVQLCDPSKVAAVVVACEDLAASDDEQSEEDDESSVYEIITHSDVSPADSSVADDGSYTTSEGISVRLVKGSIAAQKADVIFCTSGRDLSLVQGFVSKSIHEAAGDQLLQECKTRYPQGIGFGEVVKTGAHGLKCQQVFHGVCPKWDQHGGRTEPTLRKLISKSLLMANGNGMTSIAFPSIGTGNLKIPHGVVARAMVDEVKQFSVKTGRSGALKEISFVVYERDQETIDAFQQELTQQFSGLPSRRSGGAGAAPYPTHSPTRAAHHSNQHRPGQKRNVKTLDCKVGDVNFVVKYGDLTQEKCDAIVNSTNEKLDLHIGGLSKAIVKAGGESIAQECRNIGRLTEGMAITGAGNLPCRHIFHLCAKPAVKAWKELLGRCFNEAEKRQITSLAIPPVGTGYTGAGSAKEMAEAIFEQISEFAQTRPLHLTKICVTIQQRGMADDFAEAVEKAEKSESQSGKHWLVRLAGKIVTFFTGEIQDDNSNGDSSGAGRHGGRRLKDSGDHRQPASNSTTLTLYIYGMELRAIDAAVKDIDQLCNSAVKTRELNSGEILSWIGDMSHQQIASIESIGKNYDVVVEVKKQRGIKLTGSTNAVSTVVEKIFSAMVAVKSEEIAKREAEAYAKQAVWEYKTSAGKLVKYDLHATGLLEKSYHNKTTPVTWTDNTREIHSVCLKKWEDSTSGSGVLKVKRYVPGQIALPAKWDKMQPIDYAKGYLLVSLPKTSQEYQAVEQNLRKTSGGGVTTIVKIERIQNPKLYKQYKVRQIEMNRSNPAGHQNEQRMWHGTAGANVPSINADNFNRNFGGQHGLSIGNGVYFASQASYSVSGYCPADASGLKYIYQARVLSGRIGPGQGGLKVPPPGSDSVGNAQMVVIFFDAQAYPEYLITFQ